MKKSSLGSIITSIILWSSAHSAFAVERLAITCRNAAPTIDGGNTVRIFRDNEEGTLRAELVRVTFGGTDTYEMNVCETIDPRSNSEAANGSIICNEGKFENGYSVNVATGGLAGVGNATVYRLNPDGESSKIATLACRYTTF
ncbi:MAG: hypothetical protein NT027_20400 [Proteobacteria bacterium]|nr:hypothetical protein [Pseudomonadota bacterium]